MKKLRGLRKKNEKNSKKSSITIFRKFLPLVVGAVALTFVTGNCKSKPNCPTPTKIERVQTAKKDLVMKDKKLAKIVVRALLKGLRSFDKKVRIETAWALGSIGSANPGNPSVLEAVPQLTKKVYEWGWEARREAAEALGEIAIANPKNKKLRKKVARLLTKLLYDPNWKVRSSGAFMLGRMGRTEESLKAVPRLTQMAKKGENGEMYNAIAALGQIGKKNPKNKEISKAVSHLVKLLKHKSSQLREISVWALKKIGAVEALPALHVVWLNDPNMGLRKKAREAIKTIVKTNRKQ